MSEFKVGDLVKVVKNATPEKYYDEFIGCTYKIVNIEDFLGIKDYFLDGVFYKDDDELASWKDWELELVSKETHTPFNTSLEQQFINCHHYIETQAIKITKLEEELARYNCQTTIYALPNGDKIILEKA